MRGVKAKNDRLFLEALHFFVVHNITWQALAGLGAAILRPGSSAGMGP